MKKVITLLLLSLGFSLQGQQNKAFFRNLFQQPDNSQQVLQQTYQSEWNYYANRSNGDAPTYCDLGLNDHLCVIEDLCVGIIVLKDKTETVPDEKRCQQIMGLWKTDGTYVPCGMMNTKDETSLYFYAKDTAAFRRIATGQLKRAQIAIKSIRFMPDESWTQYSEQLMPDVSQLQEIWNAKFVAKMQKQSDNTSRTHVITHQLTFAKESDREAFLRQAQTKGFALKNKKQTAGYNNGEPYVIEVARSDKTDLQSINNCTNQLWEMANLHHGTYKTWETQPLK